MFINKRWKDENKQKRGPFKKGIEVYKVLNLDSVYYRQIKGYRMYSLENI